MLRIFALRVKLALAAVGILVVAAACGGSSSHAESPPVPRGPTYDAGPTQFPSGELPGGTACLAPQGDIAFVAWNKLQNPVLQRPGPVSDPLLRWDNFRWRLLFSRRTAGNEATGLGHATSADFTRWTAFTPALKDGWSPDVAQNRDRSVLVTDTSNLEGPAPDSLVYRDAQDLSQVWGPPATPLAPGIVGADNMGDGALAVTRQGLFLVFSHAPADHSSPARAAVAFSSSGLLGGPWKLMGDLDVGDFTDAQLLAIDGKWHLVGTAGSPPRPTLFRLDGDPALPESWLHWTTVHTLDVPIESWNSAATGAEASDPALAPYLCDARRADGWFYLLYAGSNEHTEFGGLGHLKIGVARSRDLKTWHVPPG